MIIVSKDGNGDYTSVTEAVKNALEGDTIFIKNGIYKERPEIFASGISIIGEDKTKTIIESGNYALMPHPDGKLGTFRSYTMLINADNVTVRNLTVSNNAGFGSDVGQAVALYAEGNNLIFEDCQVLGHQDTLFTGPLPHKEIEKGGFRGPTENAPRIQGTQIYRRCYIEGEVDFIFGSARVLFEECELFSINCGKEINGYVTASSAYENEPVGYVFLNCNFTGNCPDETVYIGRPWRNYAKTILIDCKLGKHIKKECFHDWNKKEAHKTVNYGLYNCTGHISEDTLPPFVRIISKNEAEDYLSAFNSK